MIPFIEMANDRIDLTNFYFNRSSHSSPNETMTTTPSTTTARTLFSVTFPMNPSIIDIQERSSTSRSSTSANSSLIDMNEERPESASRESPPPAKRLCNQKNLLKLNDFDEEDVHDLHPHHRHHRKNSKDLNDIEESSNGHEDKSKPLRSFLIKDILSDNNNKDFSDSDQNNDDKLHKINRKNSEASRGFIRPWDDNDAMANQYLTQLNMASSFIQTLQYNAALGSLHPNHLALLHSTYSGAFNNYQALHHNRRPRSADDDSRSERSESDSPESPSSQTTSNVVSSPLDALFEMTSKAFDRKENGDKSSGKSNHIFISRWFRVYYINLIRLRELLH